MVGVQKGKSSTTKLPYFKAFHSGPPAVLLSPKQEVPAVKGHRHPKSAIPEFPTPRTS